MSCTTRDDLVSALTAAGDVFTGGAVDEMAAEWSDYFSDFAEAIHWIEAGFWDAGSAAQLAEAGASPDDTISYREGRERDNGYGIDPIYAFCNADCRINDLKW